MTIPSRDAVRQVIIDTFNLESGSLPEELSVETISDWDSIGHMRLLVSMESRLGCSFREDRVHALWSEKAILNELNSNPTAPGAGE